MSYPAALEGVWLGGGAQYCKHPDSLDSDSRFEITPTKRVGYEDWSEPVRVTLISRDPMAWKVHSKLHIDESTFDIVQIMLLGSGGRVLTVVSDGHSMTYFRCH